MEQLVWGNQQRFVSKNLGVCVVAHVFLFYSPRDRELQQNGHRRLGFNGLYCLLIACSERDEFRAHIKHFIRVKRYFTLRGIKGVRLKLEFHLHFRGVERNPSRAHYDIENRLDWQKKTGVQTERVGVNGRALRGLTSEFRLKGFPSSQSTKEPFLLAVQVTGYFWNHKQTPVRTTWDTSRRKRQGGRRAHIRRDFKSGVGERLREEGHHGGFVRVVAIQIGGPDLQDEVLLVAQLDHGHVILSLTATMECNNKPRFSQELPKKK